MSRRNPTVSRLPAAILAFSSLTIVVLLTGCQSDPYCQKAIANLRAEKIQLENQFYSLKSRYESDMRRLGQPIEDFSPGLMPEYIEGEIIDDGIVYSRANGALLDRVIAESGEPTPVRAARPAPTIRQPSRPEDVAGYIQRIEVNQLQARGDDLARLLVRPLDDRGDIIPLAGDIRIRLVDPRSRSTIYENEFSESQVSQWIRDQAGQQPGIHLDIPALDSPSLSDTLTCDIQFRTADNRILKKRSTLVFAAGNSNGAITSRSPQQPARTASTPLQPDDLGGQIRIEIGDELNFDSLESGNSPPDWQPDR